MIELPSPALIGMIHVPPLPGSPQAMLPMADVLARVVADARVLHEAGFDALMIENYGDAPFEAEHLSPASVAGLALAADRVRQVAPLPLGINALRNDARAALGIAAAVGAKFIRVNVHVGVAATDQGLITGRADETLRYRRQLGARVAIFADVHVKHATPLDQPDLAEAARNTAYRGLADALIVSGSATGGVTSIEDLQTVREAVPERRVFIGSGATVENIAESLRHASGVIVGSSLREGGSVDRPVDPERARAFVRAVRG